jgi:DNA-binding transcriptional regulator YdaS (Cro superfamily)
VTNIVDKAIDLAGSQAALAKMLDGRGGRRCYSQKIAKWQKAGQVPADWCIDVEQVLDGQITRYEMRPEVFCEQSRGAA